SRKIVLALLAAIVVLVSLRPARAIELNHYAPGFANQHDFFLPPPEAGELIYAQYQFYYHTGAYRDADWKKLTSITGPLGHPSSVDADVDQFVVAPTLLWAPRWNVLGGRYGAYIVVPFGNPSLQANLETVRGGHAHANTSVWDIGDVFFQPLWF